MRTEVCEETKTKGPVTQQEMNFITQMMTANLDRLDEINVRISKVNDRVFGKSQSPDLHELAECDGMLNLIARHLNAFKQSLDNLEEHVKKLETL